MTKRNSKHQKTASRSLEGNNNAMKQEALIQSKRIAELQNQDDDDKGGGGVGGLQEGSEALSHYLQTVTGSPYVSEAFKDDVARSVEQETIKVADDQGRKHTIRALKAKELESIKDRPYVEIQYPDLQTSAFAIKQYESVRKEASKDKAASSKQEAASSKTQHEEEHKQGPKR